MKKVLLVLSLALVAFTAKAQFYVGGSLGLQTFNGGSSVNIAPELGYNLNDTMAIGSVLGWNNNGGNGSEFVIAPYFRYFLADMGPARIFCDALLDLSILSLGGGNTVTTFGVGIAPGIAFPLEEHLSLVGRFGRLGYFNNGFCFQLFPSACGSSLGLYYAF